MRKKYILFLLLTCGSILTTVISEAFEVKISGDNVIAEKKSARLTVSFQPEQANKNGTWESNNETVLQVDKNGIITGITSGEAHITFTASADTSVYDILLVSVVPAKTDVTDELKSVGCDSGSFSLGNLAALFILSLILRELYANRRKNSKAVFKKD